MFITNVALLSFSALFASVSSAPALQDGLNQKPKAHGLLGNSFGVPTINQTFDYVVVGGGNAGLTIAARLSEIPETSVAIIEAGSFYELTDGNISQVPATDINWSAKDPLQSNPLIDWGFVTTPQPGVLNAQPHYARGKTLGGCTARNYLAYQRGTKHSYQMWADQVGDQSFTFDNILPYFMKSVNFTPPDINSRGANATPEYDAASLGVKNGELSLGFSKYAEPFATWSQKGLAQIGIQPIKGLTSGELLGSSYQLLTIQPDNGARESSETAFLNSKLGQSNLVTYLNTLARRVIFDSDRKATGVLVQTVNREYVISARKEVILSAGTFQSPQLLMTSGIGPAETLAEFDIPVIKDLPGVGQEMWDHILFGPSYRVDVTTASALENATYYQKAVELFYSDQAGPLSTQGGDLLAFEKVPHQYRKDFSPTTKTALSYFPPDWPELEYLAVSSYFGNSFEYGVGGPTDSYNYATMLGALVAPLSRGNISITSNNTNDPPVINPNWLTHSSDKEIVVAGYKRIRDFFRTPAMQEIVIGPEYFPGEQVHTDEDILTSIKRDFNTVFHAAGTCKMGRANDSSAVVDTQGRVFGVQNLRVVDASIFPLLPPGHPMSTIYMVAEKIADDIRNK